MSREEYHPDLEERAERAHKQRKVRSNIARVPPREMSDGLADGHGDPTAEIVDALSQLSEARCDICDEKATRHLYRRGEFSTDRCGDHLRAGD